MRRLLLVLSLMAMIAFCAPISGQQSAGSGPYINLVAASQIYMGTVAAGVTDTSNIIVMPAAASTYNYPTIIKIVNTSSTGVYGWICNGTCATTANRKDYFFAPPGASYSYVSPFRSSVNTDVCVAVSASTTTIYASARGYTARQ